MIKLTIGQERILSIKDKYLEEHDTREYEEYCDQDYLYHNVTIIII